MYNINKVMKSDYKPVTTQSANNSYKLKLLFITLKVLVIQTFDYIMMIIRFFKPSEPENISKKLALVTGGGNGLGRSLCFRLAQEGCDLAIADIDFKSACKTAAEIEDQFGVLCRPYQCDISNKNEIYKLKNDIEHDMRGVDILVNNAGLVYVSNFLASEIEDIERTVQVNLTSQMMMTRIFVTGMIERKYGRIMTICSVASIVGGPVISVYAATKRGLDGFMRSFIDDILLSGNDKFIKTTTVYPDFINTRQEISALLDRLKHFLPRLSPERVAEDAVRGLTARKEFVFSSDVAFLYFALNLLTKNAKKFISSSPLDSSFMYESKN